MLSYGASAPRERAKHVATVAYIQLATYWSSAADAAVDVAACNYTCAPSARVCRWPRNLPKGWTKRPDPEYPHDFELLRDILYKVKKLLQYC